MGCINPSWQRWVLMCGKGRDFITLLIQSEHDVVIYVQILTSAFQSDDVEIVGAAFECLHVLAQTLTSGKVVVNSKRTQKTLLNPILVILNKGSLQKKEVGHLCFLYFSRNIFEFQIKFHSNSCTAGLCRWRSIHGNACCKSPFPNGQVSPGMLLMRTSSSLKHWRSPCYL